MNETTIPATPGTPTMHWVISGAALIWNLFGLAVYVMTVSATPGELAAQYSAAEIEFLQSVPVWATSANAIAVTAGVLGSLLLLLRRASALPMFVISLVALIVQDVHSFVIADATAVFGMVPAYIQGTVFVVAVLLLVYARSAKRRGVIA